MWLEGDLVVPEHASGVVLFAHGSGSSRHSERNRRVETKLHRAEVGTLLFDLLTPEEAEVEQHSAQLRFDIALLTERLVMATEWLREQPACAELPFGYFGASTGAAAALRAAAQAKDDVCAVVSRGGRPDLAGEPLVEVEAPTLLIVGGADEDVLVLNREALSALHAPKRLEVIPGARHLFAEPGAMDRVSELATAWFTDQFAMQHVDDALHS